MGTPFSSNFFILAGANNYDKKNDRNYDRNYDRASG